MLKRSQIEIFPIIILYKETRLIIKGIHNYSSEILNRDFRNVPAIGKKRIGSK